MGFAAELVIKGSGQGDGGFFSGFMFHGTRNVTALCEAMMKLV